MIRNVRTSVCSSNTNSNIFHYFKKIRLHIWHSVSAKFILQNLDSFFSPLFRLSASTSPSTRRISLVSYYSYKRNPIPRVREQVRRLFYPPHTCETIVDMEIGVLAHYRHIIRIEMRTMFTSDYLRRGDMQISTPLKAFSVVQSYQRKLVSTSYFSSYRLVSNIEMNMEFILSLYLIDKMTCVINVDSFYNTDNFL